MYGNESAGMSRRKLFGVTAGLGVGTLAAGAVPANAAPGRGGVLGTKLTADEAWQMLVDGNARFVAGQQRHPHESLSWRESLVNEQHPFAVIVSCADSRVPPELVFDEGLGDLFVIRAAGEVLDTAVVGSVEYAVEHLGVPLIVVLGHANCGAVGATIDVVNGDAEVSGDISTLVRAIEPAVRATPPNPDDEAFLAACVAEQAKRSAELMVERSNIIGDAVTKHGVKVLSATYALETGEVTKI